MMSDILNSDGFAQVIGVFAMVFSLLVFQANNRKQMLGLHGVANFLYFIHLYLLSGLTGALTSLLIVVRNGFYIKFKNTTKSTILPILFIVGFIFLGYFTWQDWTSLLPVTGAIFGTLAFWQKNPKTIRLLSLCVPPMWFAYGLIKGSYPIMLTELIMFASDLVGIIRYDILNKKQIKFIPLKGLH